MSWLPPEVSVAELPSRYQSIRARLFNPTVPKRLSTSLVEPARQQGPRKACIRPLTSRRDEILAIVSRRHRVGVKTIRGASRKKQATAARREAMWMMRVYCGFSYPQIGMFFGRDHTSVTHAVRKHSAHRDQKISDRGTSEKQQASPRNSGKILKAITVTAGAKSPGREPRRHTPQPVRQHGPVSP